MLEHAPSVAVVGLGYVGLPTALALSAAGIRVIGVDISEARLDAIRACEVDITSEDRFRLKEALNSPDFVLTPEASDVRGARAVIIAVPTPVDSHQVPDLSLLEAASRDVVANAVPGQTIIMTSTTYVGSTRELLVRPLECRGFVPGEDIFVAFSPERIDPGRTSHRQEDVPRVVGGVTARCTARASAVIEQISASVYQVDSVEAAELTKLYENTFRAVNIAFANEMADVSRALGLDIMQVIHAASTKPYGFMPFYPGPGVGGHCIPCDPHYLLWQLKASHVEAPVTQQAMAALARRPQRVVERAIDVLSDADRGLRGARILVAGIAYKGGVADVRESPAFDIMADLRRRGAEVDYHDPLVPVTRGHDGLAIASVSSRCVDDYDLVIVHTLHPGVDYAWLGNARLVLDATYRLPLERERTLV